MSRGSIIWCRVACLKTMRNPNEEQPLKAIDNIIIGIIAVIFLATLTSVQIAGIIIIAIGKAIIYPFEFMTAIIMDGKDRCKAILNNIGWSVD